MNNDFWVTRDVICQWFSLVTSSLVKIFGKLPHSWPKNRYSRQLMHYSLYHNTILHSYTQNDGLYIETGPWCLVTACYPRNIVTWPCPQCYLIPTCHRGGGGVPMGVCAGPSLSPSLVTQVLDTWLPSGSRALLTNNFSTIISIQWTFLCSYSKLNVVVTTNFAHATTAQLSWHVQNFVVTGYSHERNYFPLVVGCYLQCIISHMITRSISCTILTINFLSLDA